MTIVMLQRLIDPNTMHVLVATPGTDQGGIDRVMASLRSQLTLDADERLHVRFAATRGPGHIATSPFYLGAFIARMTALKAAGRLDVVHINLASVGSTYRKLVIAACCRALGIPYVIHLHGADYREFWQGASAGLSRRIRAMFAGAARIIVLGRVWAEFVAGQAPEAADRIVVLPNASARPALPHRGGGDKVHILFLGRIGERKGVPQLGEALKRMEHLPGWRATIAGDGEVEAARAKVAEYGLSDRVDLPGWVGPEGVAELIATADILVLPSFAENLPVSVIEGMAAGLAVVATPVGAVEDIVTDGETGLLVPPGDVDALTDALTRTVTDAALRHRLGEAARRFHRQRLDLEPYAKAMQDVWVGATR
ncbi:glycosyltransferase family 4 protein [Devosia sp.]|uniref:glycosyltransferase family 4 protein n=1 Tax=Devosia sp. TaxID=1871048 RepID=UPI0025B7E57D|nr:glycosyltransferase family 4 protein [Devosia sp.]